ncbi:MAG: hypothetical protein LUE17_05090 [Planctomycetaceae bacterium]|nr:hypothetical protein [Planctomycetaceae bacterium]
MEAALPMEHERRSLREWGVRLALMLAGLTVAHLGVTLFILPALGSDPFTIFVQGWAWQTGLSVGTCHVIILCLLMIVMLLTTRGYVLPGTIVCSFCGGPIIDLFSWLLRGVISPASPMAVRIASMLAGCAVLAGGMALVIKSDAGTGANDLVAVILTDKLGRFQFRWVRVCCDIFFAVTGFLLGGVLGFGSLAAALLVGPIAQFFFPYTGKLVAAAVTSLCPRCRPGRGM